MHQRILSCLCWFALAAVVSLRAQAPATPAGAGGTAAAMPPGLILAAKVTGTVTMTVNATVTPIKVDAAVPQNAKITTAANSSVVLVFSNGATTQLGANTELVIEEFLQDPFATSQKVADMTDEPSVSHTRLALNRGELVGNVKHLKHDKGSTFTVQTPVGAAGIRGTTFRIVFRPGGNGQAFFQLSTVEGNVAFAQPGAGGTPATTTTTTANANGVATLAPGMAVPQGQEISLTVTVTQNAQGVMVVTVLPPPVTTTAAISTTTMQAVTQVAQDIAVAVQNAVFTPAPVTPPAAGGAGGGTDAGGGGGTNATTTSGTTTGTTTTTITTTGTTTTTTTTTTSTVSAPNFTAQVEATTTTTSPAVTQPPRIVTNPNGNPGG